MKAKIGRHKTFFYLLLGVIFYLSYLVLKPFLSVMVLAFVTSVLFQPIYKLYHRAFKKNQAWATAFSIITVFITLLIPLIFLVNIVINQVNAFNQDISAITSGQALDIGLITYQINKALLTIPGNQYLLGREQVGEIASRIIKPAGNFLFEKLISIGSSTPEIVTRLFIFVLLLASFFPLQRKYLRLLEKLSPLDDRLDAMYIKRVLSMMESMVKGTLVIALVQGIVAGTLLALVGVKYTLFWTLLMIFAGIIPLGAGVISLPIGVVLLLLGKIWQGAIVILGTVLVVSNLDNILRPKLVSNDAKLHPALVLLGVFGGIKLFGFWGFIYGPVVMIFLTTTLEIYLNRR